MLKKEVVKTQSKELEKGADYRQLLVQAIHSCAIKFPDVAGEMRLPCRSPVLCPSDESDKESPLPVCVFLCHQVP